MEIISTFLTQKKCFCNTYVLENPIVTNGHQNPHNDPLPWAIWTTVTHSHTPFFGLIPLTNPNGSSIPSHILTCNTTNSPLVAMSRLLFTRKISHSCGAISTKSTLIIRGPTWPIPQMASRSSQPFLHNSPDWHTDTGKHRSSAKNDLYQSNSLCTL